MHCCGWIYVIRCSVNGRLYVGKTDRPDWRYHEHLSCLKAHRHKNKLLQRDYDLYGEESFSCFLLCEATVSKHVERDFMILLRTYNERYGYNKYDTMMWNHGAPTKNALGIIPKDFFYKMDGRYGSGLRRKNKRAGSGDH